MTLSRIISGVSKVVSALSWADSVEDVAEGAVNRLDAAASRSQCFSFENSISIGFRSGEYLGSRNSLAPVAPMACLIAFPLWLPRLSITPISSGQYTNHPDCRRANPARPQPGRRDRPVRHAPCERSSERSTSSEIGRPNPRIPPWGSSTPYRSISATNRTRPRRMKLFYATCLTERLWGRALALLPFPEVPGQETDMRSTPRAWTSPSRTRAGHLLQVARRPGFSRTNSASPKDILDRAYATTRSATSSLPLVSGPNSSAAM
jgi:hypothetical protein